MGRPSGCLAGDGVVAGAGAGAAAGAASPHLDFLPGLSLPSFCDCSPHLLFRFSPSRFSPSPCGGAPRSCSCCHAGLLSSCLFSPPLLCSPSLLSEPNDDPWSPLYLRE